MIDKNLSMSSFLALRYTEKDDVDFTDKISYRHPSMPQESERILVKTAEDIGAAIEAQINSVRKNYNKIGLLLSGGMDKFTRMHENSSERIIYVLMDDFIS